MNLTEISNKALNEYIEKVKPELDILVDEFYNDCLIEAKTGKKQYTKWLKTSYQGINTEQLNKRRKYIKENLKLKYNISTIYKDVYHLQGHICRVDMVMSWE